MTVGMVMNGIAIIAHAPLNIKRREWQHKGWENIPIGQS